MMQTDKGAYVRDMFAQIAPRYDAANRVISAGLDEGWRKRAIALLGAPAGGRVVDLCCGTGDLVFHLLRTDPTLRVTGIDFCQPMLSAARERARHEKAGAAHADFVEADVMSLPFADSTLDGATMGFAMRNVVDIDATLREIRRILRPGARFVNLDMSKAPNRVWKSCFDVYFYKIVPLIGAAVGGSHRAYSYLPHSLTHHPGAEALRERFESAGFVNAGFVRLMGGSIAIHYGSAP
ncbi:MAG TPA: bifunctional demethylmenaquinone methyltransferase/2-methoxy-6-polyprenyl-1,4-benzoquinol methylase UbiE [Candidatus Baltobacteraceae bacterium]|jgi:demethylmenaquinone methyltransferase/2-methoxy-6-polyprenyl-1,4-benzoquinol methylase|nr:bifunctional demethylmenaquinone methyltransferase/2-methoxy-6-polyprenyl-1,4-benzoquinol methylase UbiE [Candidatus Baltobacteraceae bacterium]